MVELRFFILLFFSKRHYLRTVEAIKNRNGGNIYSFRSISVTEEYFWTGRRSGTTN